LHFSSNNQSSWPAAAVVTALNANQPALEPISTNDDGLRRTSGYSGVLRII